MRKFFMIDWRGGRDHEFFKKENNAIECLKSQGYIKTKTVVNYSVYADSYGCEVYLIPYYFED